MGLAKEFEKEKLIIGVIYNDEKIYGEAMDILTEKFGPTDYSTEEFSFSKLFSNYYNE